MVKNLPTSAGDVGSTPRWEDPLEEERATHSTILAVKSHHRGAWWATVHGVTKSWT